MRSNMDRSGGKMDSSNDEKIIMDKRDQERLARIMAERKAESESIPLTNEEYILHEAEELRKRREMQQKASMNHKTNKEDLAHHIAPKVEKDKKTLEQIQALHLKQLQQHEIEMERERKQRIEEVKKAEIAIRERKQKEAQMVEEIKLKATTKDQMKLAIIAARKKAEEEGVEFNETEFTVKLIMAKRKEDEIQTKLRGKKFSAVDSVLQDLTPKPTPSSLPPPPPPSLSLSASDAEKETEKKKETEKEIETPSTSSTSSAIIQEKVENESTASPSTTSSEPGDPTSLPTSLSSLSTTTSPPPSSSINTTTSTPTTPTATAAAVAQTEKPVVTKTEMKSSSSSGPPKRLSEILVREKQLSGSMNNDLRLVNRQAEETRMMMHQMNQRHLDRDDFEHKRLAEAKARREAELAEEKERLNNLAMLGEAAEIARLEVQATQQRLAEPVPTNSKQAERAKLIAEAKAKAAIEKNARRRKQEARKAQNAGVILLDEPSSPASSMSSHSSNHNQAGVHIISSGEDNTGTNCFTSDISSVMNTNIIHSNKQTVTAVNIKNKVLSKASAAAKLRADALLVEARRKNARVSVEDKKEIDENEEEEEQRETEKKEEENHIQHENNDTNDKISENNISPLTTPNQSHISRGMEADETDELLESLNISSHSHNPNANRIDLYPRPVSSLYHASSVPSYIPPMSSSSHSLTASSIDNSQSNDLEYSHEDEEERERGREREIGNSEEKMGNEDDDEEEESDEEDDDDDDDDTASRTSQSTGATTPPIETSKSKKEPLSFWDSLFTCADPLSDRKKPTSLT